MSQITNLAQLTVSHDSATSWITQRLVLLGLTVRTSFDLQIAKSAHASCTCPHHGMDQCDCQIVVLLVYDDEGDPASLILHSQDGKTQLALVNNNPLHTDAETLRSKIVNALGYQNIPIS
jgi:hypothetical protein